MRNRLFNGGNEFSAPEETEWLNLESLAHVEVTSQAQGYPIEAALRLDGAPGWRAATAGRQTIRLLFKSGQAISVIELCFREEACMRTQEFHLRWSLAEPHSWREILRQDFRFSPPGTVLEVERYRVNLTDVGALEVSIVPDVSGLGAPASLESLRIR